MLAVRQTGWPAELELMVVWARLVAATVGRRDGILLLV